MVDSGNLFLDLEDKKRKICKAAVDIFSQKSFDKTKVSEIASRAGVGKGTFYLYFTSKPNLLYFLLEQGSDRLIEYVEEQIANIEEPAKKLEKAIDAQLEFFNENSQYFAFYIRELWSYREGLEEQIINLKENYISIFENIIEEGVKQGQFKEINMETISSGLFGFLSISSSHWILFSQDFPLENIDQSIKEVFFRGLLSKES